MRNFAVLLAMLPGLACGGESKRDGSLGSSGRGTAEGGGGLSNGSAGAGGSSPGGSEAGGAAAQAGRSYVPEDSNVPAAGDGRLSGGSFEGNLGNGWDFCFTKRSGATRMQGSDRSAHGDTWLAFDSQKSCADSVGCRADGGDAQVGFWLEAPLPPGVPVHLYFDAINLSQTPPSGLLHVDVIKDACVSAAPLATIPLLHLGLTSDWATRCVSFTPNAPVDVFGLYVDGEAFQLGLDAFRFGPPCGN